MNARALTLVIATASAAVVACSPYDPDLGDIPFRCGTGAPLCPDGYVCVERSAGERLCVRPDAEGLPDGGDLDTCGDDNGEEPNDTLGTPTPTRIPDFQDTYSVQGFAICPESDIDTYRFRVDTIGRNIKVEIMYSSANGQLQVDILNNGGNSIRTGEAVGGNNDLIRAEVPNAATGDYYVQVRSTTGSSRNSYDMTLSLTGP